jgi:hypothetical protein
MHHIMRSDASDRREPGRLLRDHLTQYRYRHYRDGGLIWASGIGDVDPADEADVLIEQPVALNAVADEGEQLILDVFFRDAAEPTNFTLRLTGTTPTETSTLGGLTEVTGTGYAGITVARNTTDWPTLALVGGDYKVTMLTKTFTATGTWTAATYMYLATTSNNTGKLVSYSALSASRTLVNGDTLAVDYSVTAS